MEKTADIRSRGTVLLKLGTPFYIKRTLCYKHYAEPLTLRYSDPPIETKRGVSTLRCKKSADFVQQQFSAMKYLQSCDSPP